MTAVGRMALDVLDASGVRGFLDVANLESTVSKSDNTKLDDATVQLKGFSDADDDEIRGRRRASIARIRIIPDSAIVVSAGICGFLLSRGNNHDNKRQYRDT